MRNARTVIAALALGALTLSAFAQPEKKPEAQPGDKAPAQPAQPGGRGGPGGRNALSAEKSKAAWELQVKGIAKHWGLNDEQSKALTKAYAEARTSQTAAMEKATAEARKKAEDEAAKNGDNGNAGPRGRGGPMGADFAKTMETVNKAEKEKFEKALPTSLSADQKAKVLSTLGGFNRQWDSITDTIAGFKLEDAKQQIALEAVEEYIVGMAKARPAPGAGQQDNTDREAMRTQMQDLRKKLTDSTKKVLSEEQQKTFENSLGGAGMRGGQGGRGGNGGGGAGGGAGGGENPPPARRTRGNPGGGGGGGGGF